MKSLEGEFGVELFVRRGRRIELTETGGGLLDITRRLFADEKEAADYLNETRELRTGHLRVGAVGPYHVTDMLAAFNARHPGLYVSVTVGNSRQTAGATCSTTAPTWRCWPMSIPIRGWWRSPTGATGSW